MPPSPSGADDDPSWIVLKLLLSILIDIIGLCTYLVPVLGEAADALWAPFSAFLIFKLYHSAILASIGFLEEILPGTDFIPTATVAWFAENGRTALRRLFHGERRSSGEGSRTSAAWQEDEQEFAREQQRERPRGGGGGGGGGWGAAFERAAKAFADSAAEAAASSSSSRPSSGVRRRGERGGGRGSAYDVSDANEEDVVEPLD